MITAPASASLEFAKHLLEKLQVYSRPALDAWYGLFRTGRPEHYFAFVEALKKAACLVRNAHEPWTTQRILELLRLERQWQEAGGESMPRE